LNDYERFGVDADDASAQAIVDTASYLEEHGVPIEEIRALRTLDALSLRAWRHIFGLEGTPLEIADAAAATDLTVDQVHRYLRALGLPMDDDTVITLTADDIEILQLFRDFAHLIGEEQVVHLARVIGSSVARAAESVADAIRVNVEGPPGSSPRGEVLKMTDLVATHGLPRLAFAMDRILRYHILRVSAQAWNMDAGGAATTSTLAVGFADMVGFTARSGSLSTNDLAAVIDRFESRVSETISASGGRVVKFIGDEVLFTFTNVLAGCRCARELLALAADATIPDVRVGIAYGDVVTRFGDCYGPVVNLAARLVQVAPPNSVLATPEIAERTATEFAWVIQEPVVVKGIDDAVENVRLVDA
jgi:adenylate cyclase